jgi:polyhydroxybutyrate depolymerase
MSTPLFRHRPQQLLAPRLLLACLTLALAACGGGDSGSGSGNGTPPDPSPQVFRFDRTLTLDGRDRSYTLNLPPNYYSSTSALPLVIAMHGGGGNSAQFEASSLLTRKADSAGFAVVYPNGTSASLGLNTWNGGGCCGSAVTNNVDDVAFVRALITDLISRHRLDPRRVYATGHSNGGIMSYRLACELSDRIAAVAPNAGPLMVASCTPARPVPVLHMHSKLDTNVPVAGGFGSGIAGVGFPSVASSVARAAAANGCAATATVLSTSALLTRSTWAPCRGGAAVELILTEDGGHSWPGGTAGTVTGDPPSAAINGNDELWAFFQRYTLP